ncbi:hypothetical protein ACFW9I_35930 [[Kitasatospora] papulosa]|uniref:hypothetical protein n=1 Tax=[Kitasatospora] papulosa TaxID=1464011 RepID=UPI00369CBBBB
MPWTHVLVVLRLDPDAGDLLPGITVGPRLRASTDEVQQVRVPCFVTAPRTLVIALISVSGPALTSVVGRAVIGLSQRRQSARGRPNHAALVAGRRHVPSASAG